MMMNYDCITLSTMVQYLAVFISEVHLYYTCKPGQLPLLMEKVVVSLILRPGGER